MSSHPLIKKGHRRLPRSLIERRKKTHKQRTRNQFSIQVLPMQVRMQPVNLAESTRNASLPAQYGRRNWRHNLSTTHRSLRQDKHEDAHKALGPVSTDGARCNLMPAGFHFLALHPKFEFLSDKSETAAGFSRICNRTFRSNFSHLQPSRRSSARQCEPGVLLQSRLHSIVNHPTPQTDKHVRADAAALSSIFSCIAASLAVRSGP